MGAQQETIDRMFEREKLGRTVDEYGRVVPVERAMAASSGELPDYSDKYNTSLSKTDEVRFKAFLETTKSVTGRDLAQDLSTYDMRGWWRDNKAPEVLSQEGHFTDRYKKPNHPGFSSDSMYSTKEHPGGSWKEDPQTKAWEFRPSEDMLTRVPVSQIMQYMSEGTKDKLVLPAKPLEKAGILPVVPYDSSTYTAAQVHMRNDPPPILAGAETTGTRNDVLARIIAGDKQAARDAGPYMRDMALLYRDRMSNTNGGQ